MRQHARPVLAAVLMAAAGLSGLALAQDTGSKIGVLNSQEVLEKSAEGKKALAQLQAADKRYGDQILTLDDQIKQLQSRLQAQRMTLTAEAAAGIQAEIQKKQTERQRAAEDATQTMQQLQASVLSQIQSDLMPIIEQLRKDKGLDLIFDVTKGGTVFFSPAIDLTAEIIRRYDAAKAAPAAPPVKK
jgi:outer membrane protein